MSSLPSRLALASLLWASLAASQVAPGHFLATTLAPGNASGSLVLIEPLGRTVTPLQNLALLPGVPRRAVLAPGGAQILVALGRGALADIVVLAALSGTALSTVTPYATGFQGAITGLVLLPSGRLAVATSFTLYEVPLGGGPARAVMTPAAPLNLIDLTLGQREVAALAADPQTGAGGLWTWDQSAFQLFARPLPVQGPTGLGYAPAAGMFLVANALGNVLGVDEQSFVLTPLAQTGLGAIRAFAHHTNDGSHLLGTFGYVHQLTGKTLGQPLLVLAGMDVADLDFQPYRARFTTEGLGCATGLNLVPQITAVGAPYPGNPNFALSLANGRANGAALLLVGVDRVAFDLTPLGAPMCLLLTRPLALIATTAGTGGRVVQPLPIPPDAGLAGGGLSLQWCVVDPQANALGLAFSNRGRADL